MIRFISWGWKGAPQIADLKRVIERVSAAGPAYVHEVPSGMADYMMAITDRDLSAAEIAQAYDTWVARGFEND